MILSVPYMISLGLIFVLVVTKSWKTSYSTALFILGVFFANITNYFHIGGFYMCDYILEVFAGISLIRAVIIKREDNLRGLSPSEKD